LGYGFVEFETEEQAQSAVNLLNKKNIDGRDINVEVAKPREEKPQQQQQQQLEQTNSDQQPRRARGGSRRPRGRGGYQSPSNNNTNDNNNQNNRSANSPDEQSQAQNGESVPRASRPKRGPRYNIVDGQQSPAQGQQQGQEGEASSPQTGEYVPRGRGRGRGGRGGRGRGGRGRRGPYNGSRAPRPQTVESTTSLFIANLPFDLDDAKLLELFKEHKAVSAHVVTNYQGRSRGFGFVEFDEKDQKTAFEATNQNKIVANTRPLTVKIALVEDKQNSAEAPEGDVSAQPADTPAQQN
jgi:RNA recognition motif-containing protein